MAKDPKPKASDESERLEPQAPEYPPHPFTEIFPPMSPEEREALEKSIRENGLREPIILDALGRIVDGLNRYRACIAVGVMPRFEVRHDLVTDEAILAFINDRNNIRRHLTTAQRAAIGAEITERKRGRPAANSGNSQISVAAAAKMLGVSESSIEVSKATKRASGALHSIVKVGGISANAAENVAKLPPEERSRKVAELKASMEAIGPKQTNKSQRAQRNGSSNKRRARTAVSMLGTNPLTNKVEPLVGYYANVMAVAKAIPLIAAELRAMPEHTAEHKLSPQHASDLIQALNRLRKVDYEEIKAAADDATNHLRGLNKNDTPSADTPMSIEEVLDDLAAEHDRNSRRVGRRNSGAGDE